MLGRDKKAKKSVIDDDWLEDHDDILRRRILQNEALEVEKSKKKLEKVEKIVTVKIPRVHIPKSVTFKLKVPKLPKIKKPTGFKLPAKISAIAGKLHLSKLSRLRPYLGRYKKLLVTLGCVLGVVLFVLTLSALKHSKNQTAAKPKAVEKAGFNPLIPIKKKAEGQKKEDLTYIPDKKVLRYEDEYLGKKIVVSQQSLGSGPTDPSILFKAADSIGAKESVDTELGKLYYVQVPKSDTQLGVLMYKNLLVFFNVDKPLDPEDWQQYVKGLTFAQ